MRNEPTKTVEGFLVVTAVGEKHVGRIDGLEGNYYIVRRSFSRARYPLPKKEGTIDLENERVLMRIPRKQLFEAPTVSRRGELDPATDAHYSGR